MPPLTPTQAARVGWWRDAVIYQIYPRSFADSNGDGVGDLRGITLRLGYLADLGVDALWLSPFYPSPQADGGYDVADYCDVDPMFGTLTDFDLMLARAHQLGLRVIVDIVPNHTSAQHPWFQEALAAGPDSPARDRYHVRVGRGTRGEEPPNNWQSIFGGPAWTAVIELTGRYEDRGEWYLHLFAPEQPDLNWHNPDVRVEFEHVLRFWLDRGVDGFRVDVAHGMIKHPHLPDWSGPAAPPMGDTDATGITVDGNLDLGPMFDQPEVHDIYRRWRQILEQYPGDRVLVAEAPVEPVERLAHYVRPDEMHQAFNFAYLHAPWDAAVLRKVIDTSLAANDAVGAATTWVLSNHDVVRHASLLGLPNTGRGPNGIGADDPQPDAELGLRRARAATLLTLALPGSAYLYQGEELGLPEHTTLDDAFRQDPTWKRSGHTERGRDGCRVPLPWSPDLPAYGFSPTGKTWLPQPPDWSRYAADAQAGAAGATLEMYRRAIRLRRQHRLGLGHLTWADLPDHTSVPHLAYRNATVTVVTNLSPTPLALPSGAHILIASDRLDSDGSTLLLPSDTTAWLLAT
ncbi:MAG TPA: glycoside hydrolase family 13 protein [Actinoplanes sp.]|nr:glycoside hydrolase family 13 protein [Actinoplanes sp.]